MKADINIVPQGSELTIRTGEALAPKADKSIKIDGVLGSPYQFFIGREFDPLNCHLQIQHDKGVIQFRAQDTNPYTEHVITGSLTKDQALAKFAINTETRWAISEFLKFIKTMRYYFADKAAHTSLVEAIQKWSVNIERVINEHNDNRGNSNFQLETKVRAMEGFISKFDLLIPIFQGYQKMKFTVEIGLDPKNTSVQLYLFSDELIELEISHRESIMTTELANFSGFDCAKVVLS
jgi:hypothetical protein